MKSERDRYFEGKILTAVNLQTEQTFFLEKLRRHNRFLHGYGIVNGLEASIHRNRIEISPGIAIDCQGNEFYLDETWGFEIPPDGDSFFVTAEYREIETNPVPGILRTVSDKVEPEYECVRDYCHISLEDTKPVDSHTKLFIPGDPGCGIKHPITIAELERVDNQWHSLPRNRR